MALKLFQAVDSSITKEPYVRDGRKSPHPSPQHVPTSYRYPSTASLQRYFIQPMDLCEPNEDIFGYTQVCSLRLSELSDLRTSKLNSPVRVRDGKLAASYTVRLWSRASGRYLQILPIGAIPYARAIYGPQGPFKMFVLDEKESLILFRSTSHPHLHLAVHRTSINGTGTGGEESVFRLIQNADGYIVIESYSSPGSYLGVRHNGNMMPTDQVDPDSIHAQFIIQKEAMDLI